MTQIITINSVCMVEPQRHELLLHWLNYYQPRTTAQLICCHANRSAEEVEDLVRLCTERGVPTEIFIGEFEAGAVYSFIAAQARKHWQNGWILLADADEFLDDSIGWQTLIAEAEADDQLWIAADFVDRMAIDGGFPLLDSRPLDTQFPVWTNITAKLLRAASQKCVLTKWPHFGKLHYFSDDPAEEVRCSPQRLKLHHFKWHGDVVQRYRDRLELQTRQGKSWVWQLQNFLNAVQVDGTLDYTDYLWPGFMLRDENLTLTWDKYDGLKAWGWYLDDLPSWKSLFAVGSPVKVLEIGAFDGVSANTMLDIIFTHPESEVYAIDAYLPDPTTPQVSERTKEQFLANAIVGGHDSQIHLYEGLSCDVLAWMISQPEMLCAFDFIYIDGSHQAKDVLSDAVMSWNLLKPGGIMAFDDYHWNYGKNEFHRPRIGIDAFATVFADRIKLVKKGGRMFYQKTEGVAEDDSCTRSCERGEPGEPSEFKRLATLAGWAINEDDYDWLLDFVITQNAKNVLEFGPGDSTLAFLEAGCRVVSYENDSAFLDQHKIRFAHFPNAEIRHCELDDLPTIGEPKPDLVFVDGPPRISGNPLSRYEQCRWALANGIMTILHDAHRAEEQATLELLKEQGASVELIQTVKGLAVISPHYFKRICTASV